MLDVRDEGYSTSEAGSSVRLGGSRHGLLGAGGLIDRRNEELRERSKTYVLRVRRDVPFRHVRTLVCFAALLAASVVAGYLKSRN